MTALTPWLAHVFKHDTYHCCLTTASLTPLGQPCPEPDLVDFFCQQAHRLS